MVENSVRNSPYSDLDLDFIMNPGTNDIAKKTGTNAIIQSVKNLVLTNFYDRPFRSHIGSNCSRLLFEPISPITQVMIEQAVKEVIVNFEPRVSIISIVATVDAENNGYNMTLTFTVNNRLEPLVASFFLQRIR